MPGPLSCTPTLKRSLPTRSMWTQISGRMPASSQASRALSTASLTVVSRALRGLSKPSRWRFLAKNSLTEMSRLAGGHRLGGGAAAGRGARLRVAVAILRWGVAVGGKQFAVGGGGCSLVANHHGSILVGIMAAGAASWLVLMGVYAHSRRSRYSARALARVTESANKRSSCFTAGRPPPVAADGRR